MVSRFVVAGIACLTLLLTASAKLVPVTTSHGKSQKWTKGSLTFQRSEEGGKFGKALTLTITAGSRITTLAPEERDKTLLMTQRSPNPKELAKRQLTAVFYASPMGNVPVLLSAVIYGPEQ